MLWYCRVKRLDGDYGILIRTDDPAGEEFMVARALLPEEITEGCLLKCENFVYEIARE